LLAQVVLTRAVSFADDFAGARAYAGVTATTVAVLDVHRNGAPIGAITFGIGASTGTFATTGGGAETFAAGDRLAIINENPADATLADLSITFFGKRTSPWPGVQTQQPPSLPASRRSSSSTRCRRSTRARPLTCRCPW